MSLDIFELCSVLVGKVLRGNRDPDTHLSTLPWTESNGQLPARYQDAKMKHLHRFVVCGHDVIFLDYL